MNGYFALVDLCGIARGRFVYLFRSKRDLVAVVTAIDWDGAYCMGSIERSSVEYCSRQRMIVPEFEHVELWTRAADVLLRLCWRDFVV